jgi:ADP-ribosyltransferase exoenzyme
VTITAQLAETISSQFDMASKAHDTAAATARATMEREMRDDHGQWARAPGGESGFHGREATAGSGIQERAESYIASLRGKVKPRELDNYNVGTYKRETLNPAYHYTPAQTEAIRKYTDHSFEMNADLRGDELERRDFQKAKLTEEADQISAAMQPLPDDLVLLRELNGAHRMDALKAGDVIADDAFASTTLTSGSGRYAANRSDTTVMHILVPAGTPSVWVGAAAGTFPEDETILDRGQPMIVMKPPALSPGRSNVTDVYLLALPKAVAP